MREATAMLTETRVKKLTSESGFYSSAGGSICTPLSIKLSEERKWFLGCCRYPVPAI